MREKVIQVAHPHHRTVRRHHQGIDKACTQVLDGFLHRHHRHLRRKLRSRSRLDFQLVLNDIDDIELASTGLPHITCQSVIGRVHAEVLLVVGKRLGLAIQDGCQHFEHTGVGKSLQHDLVANAIKVALA